MSKVEIAGIVATGMMVLIALRVPLGAAMFAAGAVGYGWIVGYGPLLNYMKGLLWARFSVYDLSVIPLFLLMGQFASIAGFSRSLFRAANAWVGWAKGGVAQAAIIACACFGAISGSSVATAATMSQVVLPEMKRLKYSDRLSTGTLAAGGTLGILVPPSFILIIYAFLAEQSIIKLFAAAVVPGLLAAVLYMLAIAIYIRLYPGHAPKTSPTVSKRELIEAALESLPIGAIILAMFVGIYNGWLVAIQAVIVGVTSILVLNILRARVSSKYALLGLLIFLIYYSLLVQQSIFKLDAAVAVTVLILAAVAIMAGIIAVALYMIAVSIFAPGMSRSSNNELIEATLEAWPIGAIFLVMFTGIYRGWFTATEGAAVGATSTLILGIVRGKINFKTALQSFLPTAQASAMIYTMLLGAAMMNTALAVSQIPTDISAWANSLNYHPLVIVGGFLVLFVVLSCVLDELAMMLLLLPVVLPTILGLDLFGMTVEHKAIWFGILMLVVVSVGLIAPPVGLAVYVVANIAKDVPIGEIYRGIVPFLISDVVRVILLLFFPALTLYALRFVN